MPGRPAVPSPDPSPFAPCTDGTRLGLGGAPLGNLFAPVDEGAARTLMDAAWADGCRSFDTAPHYGHGLSERRLGDALRARPREAFVLSSKVGRLLRADPAAPATAHGYVGGLPFAQHWDYSADGVRRSLEDSLQRLGLARIDLLYVHDCDALTHGPQATAVRRQVIEQTLPTLHRLKAEGLVRAVGLGVNDTTIVLDVLREADLDVLLLAGRYTLLDHGALPQLLPACRAHGVRVALGGVFNSGLLAGGAADATAARFDYAPASRERLARTVELETICAAHGVPLRAAALQFPLAHPAIDLVLLGARSAAEWHDARAMLRHPIPTACWDALRAAGLLPDEAPVPGPRAADAPPSAPLAVSSTATSSTGSAASSSAGQRPPPSPPRSPPPPG